MPHADPSAHGAPRPDRVQRLPLLRAVLPGVSGDGAARGVRARGPRLPGEPVPQLRRVPLRLPVRAAARVRHQRAAYAGGDPARLLRALRLAAAAGRADAPQRLAHHRRPGGGVHGAVLLPPRPSPRPARCGARSRAATSTRSCRTPSWSRCSGASLPSPCWRSPSASPGLRATSAAIERRGRAVSEPAGRDWRAIRDALTLRHLHAEGADCVSGEEERRPWRRWWHHLVLGGFLLCFASTTVAAIYHGVFGWLAPYGVISLPVVLGTLGGVGAGRRLERAVGAARPARPVARRSGAARGRPLVSGAAVRDHLTGLALLVLRDSAAMGVLLIVHLGDGAGALRDAAVRKVRARFLSRWPRSSPSSASAIPRRRTRMPRMPRLRLALTIVVLLAAADAAPVHAEWDPALAARYLDAPPEGMVRLEDRAVGRRPLRDLSYRHDLPPGAAGAAARAP